MSLPLNYRINATAPEVLERLWNSLSDSDKVILQAALDLERQSPKRSDYQEELERWDSESPNPA